VHEIKHDGYRLIVRRDGDRVRLFTRRGYDGSGRYPPIMDAARRLNVRSIIIDGEAVVVGDDGRADFDRLQGCLFPAAESTSNRESGSVRQATQSPSPARVS